jgi:hypothetical protein
VAEGNAMNMPFWLLRLLPMWDYVCPKCQKNVPKNSHQCPHCREKYPMPLKLPPSILKDKKLLEEYVHKHVFPQVSQAYKEYLTQFFTELFNNGFEEGNFSAWTGTTTSNNGAITVVSDQTHHGSYSAYADSGTPTQGLAYAYKDITDVDEVYFRVYVRLNAIPTGNFQRHAWMEIYGNNGANPIARVGIYCYPTPTVSVFLERYYPSQLTFRTTYAFETGVWYCVELYFNKAASGTTYQVWINEVSQISRQDDTNGSYQVDRVAVGVTNFNAYQGQNWIDCVVVADEGPIGPEEEATLKTVTDSFSLSESVLRNKTLTLSDSLGLADSLLRDKSLLLSDSASLSELVTVIIGEVIKYVTDSVSSADLVSTPSRVLRALEAIGATDNAVVNKVLQITETVSLAEIVEVGVGGVKKTKLFLILGDLAVQLTGD